MANNKKSPARKQFCVWADHINRVYQYVNAQDAQQAHRIAAENSDGWQPCHEHETSGFQLSNDVQDLGTEEFTDIAPRPTEHTPLPWRTGLSECKGVYGGEKHWAILGAEASGIVADIEGGLSPKAKANAELIERACNSFGELVLISEKLLERLNLCCCLHAYDERVIRQAEKIIDEVHGKAA